MGLPEGYVEYQRREYCKAVECPVQKELESTEKGSSEYEDIRYRCRTPVFILPMNSIHG